MIDGHRRVTLADRRSAMRLLIVCMPDSVDVARWIRMIARDDWDVHVFPVYDQPPHLEMHDVTFHDVSGLDLSGIHASIRVSRLARGPVDRVRRAVGRSPDRAKTLASVVRRLQPDIVHSQEFQHSSYLTLDARRLLEEEFPPWIASNWGSDIYLFGRLPAHRARIADVLATCDYYACECDRDVDLARRHGLRGQALPVIPVGGGFDLGPARAHRAPGPTSARRTIALKGDQGEFGRAMVGLRAIQLCGERLAGYRVALYLATREVETLAGLLCRESGLEHEVVSRGTAAHEEILAMHGRSRVSIGLSISGAISTSFLETIVMGSFPIQSNTGCANEWIEDGVSGALVHPDDPDGVAVALIRAIENDELVDGATAINDETVKQRLDMSAVRPKAIAMYEYVLDHRTAGRPIAGDRRRA